MKHCVGLNKYCILGSIEIESPEDSPLFSVH